MKTSIRVLARNRARCSAPIFKSLSSPRLRKISVENGTTNKKDQRILPWLDALHCINIKGTLPSSWTRSILILKSDWYWFEELAKMMQVEQTMAHADHQLHEEAADEEMVSRSFDFKQSFCMMLSTAHSHFLHLTGVTFSNTWSFAGAWNCSEWYSKAPNCRVPYGRIGKSFQRCIRTCLFH